jgi:Cu(I)/Ag(I) efflux system membrane protein CusA/SilA
MGYNFSIATGVGFIALAGVSAEFGIIMLIYLKQAWQRTYERGERQEKHLLAAIHEGDVLRVRPKMMTVATIVAGLLPIVWGSGTGSEIMSRIAVPMVGGMVSSVLLVLFVIPVIFDLMKRRELRKKKLKYSGLGH